MQFDPDRLRLALDNGEVVELDGGTLVLGDEESPSVVLRLAPWRARSVARVLEEWSAVSRVFHRVPRPVLSELELSRTLDLAGICARRAGADYADATRWSDSAESAAAGRGGSTR
jgi:hypothetical protein